MNENGVWRTIGGRKVFIKEGQSLSNAMKDSGKFKNKNNNIYKNVVQGKDLSNRDDLLDVNDIIKEQGFDGKPILIKNEEEFEKMVKEDTVGMYRGVYGGTPEKTQFYKNMLRNGEFVTNSDNLSTSGKGLYTAAYSPKDANAQIESRKLAEKYAKFRSLFSNEDNVNYKDTGVVERFTFTKDVKIYKPKENEKILYDNQIAKKGYDAYYNRNGDYVIILNRTKMIILDK